MPQEGAPRGQGSWYHTPEVRSVLPSPLDDLPMLHLPSCLCREGGGQENLTTRFLGIPLARKALSIPLKGLAGTTGLKESR